MALFVGGVWQASNYLIPFLIFPYLARMLGASGFGTLGLGTSIAAFALLITDWGFNYTATQAAAQLRHDKDQLNQLVWATIGAKALMGGVSCALIAVIAYFAIRDPILQLVLAGNLLNVIGAVFNVDWALRGTENLGPFARTSIIGRLTSVPCVFFLVCKPGDIPQAALSLAASGPVTALLTLYAARTLGLLGLPRFSWAATVAQIKNGAHVFVSCALVSLYTNCLSLLLGCTAGSYQVGLFTGADKIRTPVQSIFSPISLVFYPRINQLLTSSTADATRTCLFVLRLQVSIACLLAAVLFVLAPFLVNLLLGEEFTKSIPVLRILSLLVPLIGTSNVLGVMIMLPFGLSASFSRCIMAGAVTGVGFAIPFSFLWGAVGTSIAAVCAEGVVAGSMWMVLAYHFEWFRYSGRV